MQTTPLAGIIARRTRELSLVGADPEHNGEGFQKLSPIPLRVALLPLAA
jgi:hypothetical protein